MIRKRRALSLIVASLALVAAITGCAKESAASAAGFTKYGGVERIAEVTNPDGSKTRVLQYLVPAYVEEFDDSQTVDGRVCIQMRPVPDDTQ